MRMRKREWRRNMLALVKTPLTTAEVRISGDGADQVLAGLKTLFTVEVEESEPATETDWYKEAKADWTPRTEVRVQRQKRGWTQEDLGSRLGVSKQVVSDLENNHRPISVKRAKSLGKIFNRDYKNFL